MKKRFFLWGLSFCLSFQALPAQDVFLLLGPPGSGKGTCAMRLCKATGYPHLSMGDLLREEIARGTEVGKQAKESLEKGELVQEELVLQVLKKRMECSDCQAGVIIDGFPRSLKQAAAFRDLLPPNTQLLALCLHLPDEMVMERLSRRIVCLDCQAPFNIGQNPPKTPGVCDYCQGKLEKRSDDSLDIILKRLKVYHEMSAPLVVFYQKEGALKSIDGRAGIEAVYRQIAQSLPEREACGTPFSAPLPAAR